MCSSDLAASLTTKAMRDSDHYIINGTKRFTTNSPHAGLFTVFARTGPAELRSRGISALLVERGTPGITVAKPYRQMGFRGSHTADVEYSDVRVPTSSLRGGSKGNGFIAAFPLLDHTRFHMAALAGDMFNARLNELERHDVPPT